MTFYILLQHVDYEGGSLKGTFASLEDALDHIDQMDGYFMDEFLVDRDALTPLDDCIGYINQIQNATGGWIVDGPGDLSFAIYACSLGVT